MNIEEMYRQMKLNEAAGSRSNDSDVGDSKTPGKLPDEHTGQPAKAEQPKAGNPGGPEKLPDAHTAQPSSPDSGKASKKTSTDAGKTKEDLEPPAGGIGKQADITDAGDFVAKDYIKDMLKKSLGEGASEENGVERVKRSNGSVEYRGKQYTRLSTPSTTTANSKMAKNYQRNTTRAGMANLSAVENKAKSQPPKLDKASVEELYQNFIAEYEAVLEENGIYEYDEEEAMNFFAEQYAEILEEAVEYNVPLGTDTRNHPAHPDNDDHEEFMDAVTREGTNKKPHEYSIKDAKKLMDKHQDMKSVDESVDTSFKLADQLGSLLESEGLTDEFKSQATTIFEAAVNAASKSHIESIQEKLQEQFDSEIETYKAKLDEQVEKYLDYVVEEWVKENRLAVESASRNNIAESFMSKLKNLLEEHYVQLPEEKADLYEAEVAHAAELETELNESIEAQRKLSEQVKALEKKLVVEGFVRELSEIEAEKIRELAEGVDFDNGFETKLKTLKENFFPSRKATSAQVIVEDSSPAVVEKPTTKKILSEMDIYLDTVNKMHSFKK